MMVAPRDERMPVIAQAPRGALHFFSFSLSAGLGTVACHRFPRFAGVVSRVSTRGVLSLASMCTRNEYAVLLFTALTMGSVDVTSQVKLFDLLICCVPGSCGALQGSVERCQCVALIAVYGPVYGVFTWASQWGHRSRVAVGPSRAPKIPERNRFVTI